MSIYVDPLLLAVQMLSALGMIGLILVQHGKGADMGAAFGSGGSGSLVWCKWQCQLSVAHHRRAGDRFSSSARWHWPILATCVPATSSGSVLEGARQWQPRAAVCGRLHLLHRQHPVRRKFPSK
jgi:preprotein translocase subunit SecG